MKNLKIATLAAIAVAALASCDPKDKDIAVTAVEITSAPSPLALVVGGSTGKVTAKVTPADATNQSVVWTVAPEGVVTLAADGTVTAVAAGTATITATASNGVKATCNVVVTVPAATPYKYKGTFTVVTPVEGGEPTTFVKEDASVNLTIAADGKTADMVMFKPKFTAGGMPPDMDITVPGIAVVAADGAYTLSGASIVPTAVMGGRDLGEVAAYTMTDFSGTASAQSMTFKTKCGTATVYDLTFTGTAVAQ